MAMSKYIFFNEGCEADWEFEIEGECSEDAFDNAFDKYGPQVQSMYCKLKH